jgi:Mycothiol maleylpyruvate isomerase N-terminal domain
MTPQERQQLRDDLALTRREFHKLLSSISSDDWDRRSANPELTVKELMWHTAWSMSWLAESVDSIKRGKSLRAPSFLVEPGRKLTMRWLARRATPERTAEKYEQGHVALCAKLGEVHDEEWSLAATRFGEMRTVEWVFRHAPEHVEEHARDVRAVLAPKVEAS